MVYHVPSTESPVMSLPKNVLTMDHKLFAMMTFFARPRITRSAPSHRSVALTERLSISCSTTLYRTIGPAMSCGKRDRYKRNLWYFGCTSTVSQ